MTTTLPSTVPIAPPCTTWCAENHVDAGNGWGEIRFTGGAGKPWGNKVCRRTVGTVILDAAVQPDPVEITVERLAVFDVDDLDITEPQLRILGAIEHATPAEALALAAVLTEAAGVIR